MLGFQFFLVLLASVTFAAFAQVEYTPLLSFYYDISTGNDKFSSQLVPASASNSQGSTTYFFDNSTPLYNSSGSEIGLINYHNVIINRGGKYYADRLFSFFFDDGTSYGMGSSVSARLASITNSPYGYFTAQQVGATVYMNTISSNGMYSEMDIRISISIGVTRRNVTLSVANTTIDPKKQPKSMGLQSKRRV